MGDEIEPQDGDFARGDLELLALARHIKREGMTQAEAAKALGVTQPRISNLVHGKIDLFALDMLVKMAAAAGLRVTMRIKKAA